MQIGAQFYTIRDFTKDLDGLSESLKKVADIGYKTVQISGTCDFDAEWMKEELRKNGLKCVITHTAPAKITGETEKVIADHKTFGCDRIGIGFYDVAKNGVQAFIDYYKDAAEKIKQAGLRLSYHNHDAEFVKIDGKLIMDHILDAFTPDELCITLDTYWVQSGGGDPIWWLNRLKGRTPCVHFKDMAFTGKERRMAVVGEGNMNFDGIIKASVDNGVEYALVEQDNCYGEDPFDCLKRSYEYLKAQGLE